MDHETNNEKPSSTEGGEMSYKIGDKVWAKATVKHIDGKSLRLTFDDDWTLWFFASDCRPVEPSNSPGILDSSSEPMREAFESSMAKKYDWYQGYFSRNENRYFDSSVEMAWQAYQAGAKYQSSPLAPSPCMDGVDVDQFIDGIMEARGRVGDPINPSHYKHLPAEAIDIIEAAIAKAPSNQYAFLQGQVVKYLLRCWSKKGIEDLRKAKWYLDRLVKEVGE
jgi:hypothetical protein